MDTRLTMVGAPMIPLMPDSLDSIAIRCETDWATKFTRTWGKPHGYAPHYDRAFSHLRDQPIKLLEIGAASGEGIRMWLQYFPQAQVVGVDIVSKTNLWNTPGESPDPRYKFCQGDQACSTFWACFLADYGKDWDIIIDDGGHYSNQVIISFENLWPALRSGGLYAIEDLGVSYGAGSVFLPEGWPNHMDFLKAKLDEINCADTIASMNFSKELAIIKKA